MALVVVEKLGILKNIWLMETEERGEHEKKWESVCARINTRCHPSNPAIDY